MVRSADGDADDPTRVVVGDTPSHRADAGMAWGTLIHGLLEHAMRHKTATRDDLRRLAMWLTVEEPQLRAVIADGLQTVEVVAVEYFWKKAITSEHQVEVPFCVCRRFASTELMARAACSLPTGSSLPGRSLRASAVWRPVAFDR
jgi:hypothetical protein